MQYEMVDVTLAQRDIFLELNGFTIVSAALGCATPYISAFGRDLSNECRAISHDYVREDR